MWKFWQSKSTTTPKMNRLQNTEPPPFRLTDAELLLLSKFLYPSTIDSIISDRRWPTVLGNDVLRVVEQFKHQGLLAVAALSTCIERLFSTTTLKELLKEHGLPVSGKKEILIQRLMEADSEALYKATANMKPLLECSDTGRVLAQAFVNENKAKEDDAIARSKKAAENQNFKEAAQIIAKFQASRIFPGGLWVDWKSDTIIEDMAEDLRIIYSAHPKILTTLTNQQLDLLRPVAAYPIRGKYYLPSDFQTGRVFDGVVAARMLSFYACGQRELKGIRAAGYTHLKISSAPDSCAACKKLSKKTYSADNPPELPHPDCTHEMGCRCLYTSISKTTRLPD